MAISRYVTLLSLDEFAESMQISPWLLSQLDPNMLGMTTTYKAWFQSTYQTASTISRDEAAAAILSAEEALALELAYWPAPKDVEAEEVPYPHMYDPRRRSVMYNDAWQLKSVELKWGHVIAPGKRAYTILGGSVPVTTSDRDGDGKLDWFVSDPVATTVTDPNEIVAAFRDADRVDVIEGGEPTWQIRPVKVALSGGNAVVSGPIWLLVKPTFLVRPAPQILDPTDPLNFVTSIKISRSYIDDAQQGLAVYKPHVCDSIAGLCDEQVKTLCLQPKNREQGVVIPHITDTTALTCGCAWRAPDRLQVNYVAGVPLVNGRVEHTYALMISRLAACRLSDRSGTTNTEHEIDYWRGYPSTGKGDRETTMISPATQNNPFGLRRGEIWAWSVVLNLNERRIAGAI